MALRGLAVLVGGQDGATDQLGYLGDYGVSESSKAVQSMGNPIIHSPKRGKGFIPKRWARNSYQFPQSCFRPRLIRDATDNLAGMIDALGVANNPDPISGMWGANGGSLYAMPFCIIPERGQVSENDVEPSTKQSCDILHDKELWSNRANKTDDFRPQPRSLASQARAAARVAKVLTREPAADDIDGNSIGSKAFCGKGPDVVIARHLGPVLRKHATGEGFDLAKRNRLKTARALQPQREPADAGEQVQHAQHRGHPWPADRAGKVGDGF